MKKVILLAIILLGILIIPIQNSNKFKSFEFSSLMGFTSSHSLKNLEIKNWEYLKTRLFEDGKSTVAKFKGPILINLDDASPIHKVAVDEAIKEIKELLPNKTFTYYKKHTGYDYKHVLEKVADSSSYDDLFYLYTRSIKLCFKNKPSTFNEYIPNGSLDLLNPSILKDGTIIKRTKKANILSDEIKGAIIYFNFSDSTTYKNQKKYIKYELMKSLCELVGDNHDVSFKSYYNNRNKGRYNYSYENGVFKNDQYSPDDYKVTERDKFLIQKLYSDNFSTQFNSYLNKYYSYRYQLNFLNRKEVRIATTSIIIILGILIFILSFQILHNKRFRFSFLSYFIPVFIISFSFLQLNLLKSFILMEFHSFHFNLNLSFVFILSIAITSCIQSFVLWGLEKILIKKVKSFILELILKTSLTLIVFTIPYFVFDFFKSELFQQIFNVGLLIAVARGLYIYLNHYSDSLIKQKDVELSQLKELQAATELNSLHAQINPHFLYNSLNSIASLAHINANKTEKMALSLSDLFRYSINRKDEKMTTIKNEVEMVENYLKIEKIRFEDRLEFSVDVEDSLLETNIPRFILQPIIENAVKHGISKVEKGGVIRLQITKNNNDLLISVSDNGPDFPEGLLSGHGLQSVYDLLRLSYGEQATMNWENLPEKKITISIRTNS